MVGHAWLQTLSKLRLSSALSDCSLVDDGPGIQWNSLCRHQTCGFDYIFVNYINNQINNLCVASIFGVISDCMHACSVVQSCSILWDPLDCSQPSSSVHRIFQARILEWVAISFFRWSFQPRNRTHVSYISCISKQILCHRTTWEAQYLITSLLILLPRRGIFKEGKTVIGRTFWISERASFQTVQDSQGIWFTLYTFFWTHLKMICNFWLI